MTLGGADPLVRSFLLSAHPHPGQGEAATEQNHLSAAEGSGALISAVPSVEGRFFWVCSELGSQDLSPPAGPPSSAPNPGDPVTSI